MMAKVTTINNLSFEGGDFTFDGNLRLLGETNIESGNLIVNGDLVLGEGGSTFIKNGGLIAKSIMIDDIDANYSFYIENGDVHVTEDGFFIGDNNITVWGSIVVEYGDLVASKIFVYDLFVNGKVDALSVEAHQDIFFSSGNICKLVSGKDVYIEEDCSFNGHDIHVSGDLTCDGNLVDVANLDVKGNTTVAGDIFYATDVESQP